MLSSALVSRRHDLSSMEKIEGAHRVLSSTYKLVIAHLVKLLRVREQIAKTNTIDISLRWVISPSVVGFNFVFLLTLFYSASHMIYSMLKALIKDY